MRWNVNDDDDSSSGVVVVLSRIVCFLSYKGGLGPRHLCPRPFASVSMVFFLVLGPFADAAHFRPFSQVLSMDLIAASSVSIVSPLSSATLVASSSSVARAVVNTAGSTTQAGDGGDGRIALGVASGDRMHLMARALYVVNPPYCGPILIFYSFLLTLVLTWVVHALHVKLLFCKCCLFYRSFHHVVQFQRVKAFCSHY